jgi:hypothetical protein
MGQAKSRGPRDQRVLQAQQRDTAIRVERERVDIEAKAREAQRVAAMPLDEQKKYRKLRHQTYLRQANMIGMLLALSDVGRGRTA